MKPNAVPTIFKNGPPPTKKLKRHDKNISQDADAIPSKQAQRPRYELIYYKFTGLIEDEKLLGYAKEGIKACVNQFKVRKTRTEN